jgi:hypothetical protein
LAVAILGTAVGCGSTERAEQGEQAESEGRAPEPQAPASQDLAQATALEGKLGCGHCTFQAFDHCNLAMKTLAGDVLLVEAGERQGELMAVRYDQPQVKIEGRVAEVDGQKVIYAESVLLQ